MRFLIRVRSPLSDVRRVVSLRRACVCASGCQTRGRKSARRSCAKTYASTLSVFIFASAIARVRIGLDTTTSAASGRNTSTTLHVLVVASRATRAFGPSHFFPKRTSSSREHAKRSRCATEPLSRSTTASTTRLWTSSPIVFILPPMRCERGRAARMPRRASPFRGTRREGWPLRPDAHFADENRSFGIYLFELVAQPGGPEGWSHTSTGSWPI